MRSGVLFLIIAIGGAGCATTGGVPRPFPVPGGAPPAGWTSPPTRLGGPLDGHALTSTALSLRGAPYRWGGSGPLGFDCSGFVQYVFGRHGQPLPREARDQFRVGEAVDTRALAPGDLVFFSTVAPGPSHVGIALGGDQFVHAPSTRGVVRVETLTADYWARRFVGAKRIDP